MNLISHHFGGENYVKIVELEAHQVVMQHKHDFPHKGILVYGTVILATSTGDRKELTGPCIVDMPAGQYHGIRTLTHTLWLCSHISDVADDDAIIADNSYVEEARVLFDQLRTEG